MGSTTGAKAHGLHMRRTAAAVLGTLLLACGGSSNPLTTTSPDSSTAGSGSGSGGTSGGTAGGTAGSGGTSGGSSGSSSNTVPAWYSAFYGNGVTVTRDGDYVVITSTDIPDHKSPYFGVGDPHYEAYNGTNSRWSQNPNLISAQQITFRIPVNPTALSTPSPTPLGPIGVALNGVPLFNQYAAGRQPLTGEVNSFDQYNGHPQQTGMYHYHVEPLWLTRASKEALIGVLLDGYPVYGPMENARTLTSSDLDDAHGHFGATKEFPQGIYHYHTTADAPYINGTGFHGSPGTVAQ